MPYAGPASADDGAQALLLSPTLEPDAAAASASGSNDTMSLIWMMVLGVMAIPALIIMALIATVLTRR